MRKSIVWIAVIGALAGVFLFLLTLPVSAQHANIRNEPLAVYAMCPTLQGALAVIEAPSSEIGAMVWNLYGCARAGQNYGVRVAIHAIIEELVWAGDGLDDMMLLMEVYDRFGGRLYTWVVKDSFAVQFPDRLRLLQPTTI